MEINIPFNEWSTDRLNRMKKVCTSRNHICGKEGDTFKVLMNGLGVDREYTIRKIISLPLWFVRDFLWQLEGADSPKEFEKVWCDIYPKNGFELDRKVFVHFFKESIK